MGIDYGMGRTNIDKSNGIRFGVISMHEVSQFWSEDSEADYGVEDSEDIPDMAEPISWYIDNQEYKAIQSRDDSDIFILKSPYYTLCDFCSPCAPGAGYLTTPGNIMAYCFGHDCFESNKAPYPVYRVNDNYRIVVLHRKVKCNFCNGTGLDSLKRIADVRGVTIEKLKEDECLMGRVMTMNLNVNGDFDCFQCCTPYNNAGRGKVIQIVEQARP